MPPSALRLTALATALLLVLPLPLQNVLLITADNFSPRMPAYGSAEVLTPSLDALAATSTLFSTALCQIAWCAPSRNSFLSGRRPRITQAYNFLDSFRSAGPDWLTLPGAFRAAGYYTTSLGKNFHPGLPQGFDAAQSWSDAPLCPAKPGCPGGTMACALPAGQADADAEAVDALLARLGARNASRPFFAALGLQAPRLPWVYPAAQAARYPPAARLPLPAHPTAANVTQLEYFRPTEIDQYTDVRNVSHDAPMAPHLAQAVRRAYYATLSAVDAQVGRVLQWLQDAGLQGCTVVAFTADHGQALGEGNMWSMMGLTDTATRVPLLLRAPALQQPQARVHSGVVELLDLYPTLLSLAGLPPSAAGAELPGVDLSPALAPGGGGGSSALAARPGAFSQITRCLNCSAAYAGADAAQCAWDEGSDGARGFAVPCALMPRTEFDWMGVSIRTAEWRYSVYCRWDGGRLAPDFTRCSSVGLFNHSGEGLQQPLFDPDAGRESVNLAGQPELAAVQAALHALVVAEFGG